MFPKRVKFIVVPLVLVAVVLGGWKYRNHQRYKHLEVHDAGMVYRSAWLEPDVLSEIIEKYQIRTVINLCRPGEMGEARWVDERRAVTNAGAKLLEISMPTSIDVDDPGIKQHLDALNDPNNYPMLVHCQHGVTRTAKHLAIYDIVFRGMTAQESLAAQPLFGRDKHNVNIAAFVKNFEKQYRKLYPQANAGNLNVLRKH